MAEITLPGVRLAVERSGAGAAPLVLLHGMASNRRLWDPVWDGLTAQSDVIRYDLRGFGDSTALDNGSFRHADDLLNLLDALRAERCDLAGISMGGSVALNFALDHPERVRRLVLISPAITAWEWSEPWRARWRAIVAAARSGDLKQARQLWWEHPLFATTRLIPDAAAALRQEIEAYSCAIWAHGDNEQAALPDLDRLPFLVPPVLLLTGAEDVPDFQLVADLIEAAAPQVTRIDFANAGHMLNLERPAGITAEILGFLAGASRLLCG